MKLTVEGTEKQVDAALESLEAMNVIQSFKVVREFPYRAKCTFTVSVGLEKQVKSMINAAVVREAGAVIV